MIGNIKTKTARDIYDGIKSRAAKKVPLELHPKIQRLFDQLNATKKIDTLRVPPSNRLEKLKGNYKDFWSLRVNKQWRVIFKWEQGAAIDVDVLDYH